MMRVEWMTSPYLSCEVVSSGTPVGEDTITAEVGIVLGVRGGDSIVVMEGTVAALLEGVEDVAQQLRAAAGEEPAPTGSRELDEALRNWAEVMDGIVAGPFDWDSCSFTCTEANAMADLLRQLDHTETATASSKPTPTETTKETNTSEETPNHFRWMGLPSRWQAQPHDP